MLVYGKNVAREVLKHKEDVVKHIYITSKFNDKEIIGLISRNKMKSEIKSSEELERLTVSNHQGIVLDILEYSFYDIDDVYEDDEASFLVILDHIEDPRNFGAIIRTCECAGVHYIIIPNKRSVEVNGTVYKASSGAIVNTKIVSVSNLNNTITKLKAKGFWIIGTDSKGEVYSSLNYKDKTALVIGSEGEGLKELVRRNCDYIASIPLNGSVNSLNASVAAGIMIYEVVRSRK
ncbi:MAG: 23S rRNA (guanosine(2251)-2'-O)-methyltransferase RlmB [Bacilli bacterium]